MRCFKPLNSSPSLLVCALAGAFACAASAAPAANDVQSIWLAPTGTSPLSAKAPLRIEISPAESQCRAAYGDEWYERCQLTLGKPGTRVQGVQLTPETAGEWRWASPSTIVFTPKEAWQPGKRFRTSLIGLPMPLRASLTTNFLTVETPPLTAVTSRAQVWIDPLEQKNRALSFEFDFTTSVSAAVKTRIEQNFTLDFDAKSGLKLGKPSFVWGENSESLYVKVPVIELADSPVVASALVKGAAGRAKLQDGRFTVPKGFEAAKASVTVPGLSTLFQITEASILPVKDDGLNAEYEITIASSLALDPTELSKRIRVLTLPKKLDSTAASDTVWTAAPLIDDEVLKRASALEVRPDLEWSTTGRVKLRLKATPGDYIYLELPKGFGPAGMPGLEDGWKSVLLLPQPSAEITFLQPGNMLTLAGSWELSLFTAGIDKLNWRIARVRNEFLSLAADGWNVMKSIAPDSWVTASSGSTDLGEVNPKRPGEARFTALDLSEAVMGSGPGLYQIELTGTRMKDGKPETVANASKRILITNIAMIAKTSASGALDLFAANFADGKPAAGLKAILLAENGTVLETTETDVDGRAHFKSTRGWEREKKPAAAALRSKGTDLAWLSLKDGSNVAETLRWDVGGRYTGGTGLSAFSFADRGIFRTGETVHFGFGVRKLDFDRLPEGTPIELKLTNDAGRVLEKRTVKLNDEGLGSFDWKIPDGTLPGTLRLDLFAGGEERSALSTTSVFVGDFSPETLSLSAELPADEAKAGWVKPNDLPISATLTSLFGAGAQGRRVTGTAEVTPLSEVKLPGWDGWLFPSPGAAPWKALPTSRTLDIEAAVTPGSGSIDAMVPLSLLELNGFADVDLTLTGTEAEGAGAVERHLSFIASPNDIAVGWRIEETPQPSWFLLTGEPASMALAVIDRSLKPKAGTRLKVTIEKSRWITTLSEDSTGRFTYSDDEAPEVRQTIDVTADDQGIARIKLLTGEPGNWLVRAADESGKELFVIPYGTAGGRLADFADGMLPTAELRAKLEKTNLNAGDTVRVSLLSPVSGFALASFESAEVISTKWVSVNAGENLLELEAPADFTGRAWLRLSVVRGQTDAKKFLKGFAETAVPIELNASAKTLPVTIKAPEKVENARRIPIQVSAAAKAKVFLFAADDGLLSLTNWQTPDPIKTMLLDRALEVDTRETLSLLMPDAGSLKDLIKAPVGGDFMASAKAAAGFGSPFKRSFGPSTVWWGGLVDVGPDAQTFTVELPEGYAGRVRVSAVGAAEASAGSAQALIVAAPPLALSPALPGVLSLGDIFRAGAVVTPNMPAEAASLTITPPAAFAAEPEVLPLNFPAVGGISASAQFSVPNQPSALGEHPFILKADARAKENGATLSAQRSESIVVRPASLLQTRLYAGRAEHSADKSAYEVPTVLYPINDRTRFIAASTPAALAPELGRPFQTADNDFGAVLPRLAASLPEVLLTLNTDAARLLPQSVLTTDEPAAKKAAQDAAQRREKVYAAVQSTLTREGLKAMPWSEFDPFLSALVLDYLVDALRLDSSALEPLQLLRSRLVRSVNLDPQTIDDARTSAYTLWVLTREGTMTTAQLEALRASMTSRFEGWERDAAASFLAAAYSRLRLRDEARSLVKSTPSTARAAGAWTPETAAALAASALSEAGLGQEPAARFLVSMAGEDLARTFAAGIVSPLYAAAAARAALTPEVGGLKAGESAASPDLVCTRRADGFPADQDRLVLGAWGALLDAPGCLAAEASGLPASPYVWWQVEQTGYIVPDDTQPADRSALEVERTYLGADGKAKTEFTAGERVTVRVRVKSFAGESAVRDAVVTDLLPGGFVWAMPAGACPEGALECRRAEDRVQWAVPALTNWEPLTFTYTVRAAYPGVYRAGSAAAESLSNPALAAQSRSAKIRITAPEEPSGTNAPQPTTSPTPASAVQ